MSRRKPPPAPTDRSVTDPASPAAPERVLAEALFADAAQDDLTRLDERAREAILKQALKLLQRRLPGRSEVMVKCFTGKRAPRALAGHCLLLTLNDDMPFLVDSLLAYLAEKGVSVKLLLHPILHVARDDHGVLQTIERRAAHAAQLRAESLIVLLLEMPAEEAGALKRAIHDILRDVHDVVLDWPAMRAELEQLIEEYQTLPPPLPVSELTEVLAFLQWLAGEHFVFLGTRAYARCDGRLEPAGAVHGLLRRHDMDEITGAPRRDDTEVCRCRAPGDESPVLIVKSAAVSPVHRRAPMDLVILKRYDVAGQETGELRILGLFTATAYVRAAQDIPLLRRKVAAAMQRSGVSAVSHRGKALLHILETFPRDDLFELDTETLTRLALQVLAVQERPHPRLIVWRSCSPLFASAFAFIPRERFSSSLRRRVGELLETSLGARVVEFTPAFGEQVMVRVHYRLRLLHPGAWNPPDMAELQRLLMDVVRTWEERLLEEMRQSLGPEEAERLWPAYRGAFSEAYKEAFGPRAALADVQVLERLKGSARVAATFFRAAADAAGQVRLKLYHFDTAVPLAARVPMLAHMGLRAVEERTFTIRRGARPREMREVFVHEMLLEPADDLPLELEKAGPLLEEGFLAVWNGEADDDHFNALILAAGLTWREVVMLRAVCRWLKQAGVHYSLGYMAQTLRRHRALAGRLVELFRTLFAPGRTRPKTRRGKAQALHAEIVAALADVPSLDEDRIIRMIAAVILAMRRTSFWQDRTLLEGPRRPFAFKLHSQDVEFIPDPKPWAEIFVHDPALEGVHLRGGPIARGGIRHSDRLQDFRTEILGLMKAQTVKNAVIVPVGAKGGFVVRDVAVLVDTRDASGRDAARMAGEAAYARFIATLLDLTDNIEDGRITPPKRVVRHDGDDPYLVVAADKGTATFSDLANALARRRNFWLDDAFASGGSAGYDHKKMGITARGAWVCVRRHFREMDIDIDATPISVIGVGDMSGDVFGNGMLIQRNIRLRAAFDHRDIFLDPDPDIEAAYAERKRLFRLPRSSWQDYDRAKVSAGGGVFSRKAKSIPLSPQVREMLDVQAEEMTPNELIRAILGMQADLLWFGGIGTFVRASNERDADVGDPANDTIRITAKELRVKVVGEGANLGLTQKARIEYAQAGGRVNMDAIDNAAGVNCSDVEVNIKIGLGAAERAGKLTREERDRLLFSMEPEVARLVLANNFRQHVCLTLTRAEGPEEAEELKRLMQTLERRGVLDRRLEDLPTDADLEERLKRGETLSRPEIAVLMSWAKIVLFDDLLACGVVDDPFLTSRLHAYFPARMREHFADEIDHHRLRREIIANRLGNEMINLGGPAYLVRLQEETGRGVRAIATAHAVGMELFGIDDLFAAIDRLDNARVKSCDQLRMYADVRHALRRAVLWLLRHDALDADIATILARYASTVHWLSGALSRVATAHARERLKVRREEFHRLGASNGLARQLARLPYLLRGLDVALMKQFVDQPLERLARIYFLAGHHLRISAVIMAARRLDLRDHDERLAAIRLIDRITALHVRLAADMALRAEKDEMEAVRGWLRARERTLARIMPVLEGLLAGSFSLARLALAENLLEELAGG